MLKGWFGELKTKVAEKLLLDSKIYHVFNNVLISNNGRTAQMDHVVVSRYGIFILETKDKTGWIFGDENQKEWTQVIFQDRYRFQNPLRQNYFHTKSLSGLLGIDHSKIHSLVVFWGDCEFRTPMPENVVHGMLAPTNYIKSKTARLLSEEEVQSICKKLMEIQDGTTRSDMKDHKRGLKGLFHSDVCPRCGGNLVVRTATRGANAGGQFLGCSNYPRCTYIRS